MFKRESTPHKEGRVVFSHLIMNIYAGEIFDFACKKTDAYERDWSNRIAWLDAAAAAGVHVLVWIGVDHLSSCRSGWLDKVLRPSNVHGLKFGTQSNSNSNARTQAKQQQQQRPTPT